MPGHQVLPALGFQKRLVGVIQSRKNPPFGPPRRPSTRLIPWYGVGMGEKASVLSDLCDVLGAVGSSHPERVLKKVMFQYTKPTRQVSRFFEERLRVTYKILQSFKSSSRSAAANFPAYSTTSGQ